MSPLKLFKIKFYSKYTKMSAEKRERYDTEMKMYKN